MLGGAGPGGRLPDLGVSLLRTWQRGSRREVVALLVLRYSSSSTSNLLTFCAVIATYSIVFQVFKLPVQ